MPEALDRLKLVVAYDGRPFAGWQSQAGGNAVQDYLEAAFLAVGGIQVRIHGSGRTDAGVHALGQVAHADVPRGQYPVGIWMSALNAHLPREIRVLRSSRVWGGRDGFHARFSAIGKRYLYRLWNAPFMHPLEIGRAWHVPRVLDLDRLREAAALLIGRHDFVRFSARAAKNDRETVRTIHRVSIVPRSHLVTLTFEGDGFLYKMVRLLTGTLVRVAEGRAPVSFITDLLSPKVSARTHFTAPAEGLYLAKVSYPPTARRNAA
ncbi:MAG: tRNA pseudouridine(38-40) synthase TruA [Chthoniobacteraceae bacterium]